MFLFFKDLIRQGSALVYIDDILVALKSTPLMLQLNKQLHDFAQRKNLKLACENLFSILHTVKDLGQEIVFNTSKPIHCQIAAYH